MKKFFLMFALVLPMALSAQKFGHVNQQEVFALMPELKQVQQKLDTLQGFYEGQYASMQEEFNKKVTDFQRDQATLPDAVKNVRQQEIADMEQRIQFFLQNAQQEIQKSQQDLIAPLQEKLLKAIQKVGADNGYTYIFDSMVLTYTSDDANDVTGLVKKELGIK